MYIANDTTIPSHMNKDIKSTIEIIYQRTTKTIILVILLFLSFESIIKTYYYGRNEIATIMPDNWVLHIVICIFTTAVICILKSTNYIKQISSDDFKSKYKILRILSFFILLSLSILWVLFSHIQMEFDPLLCYYCASDIRGGVYDTFCAGGYLNRCINQLGFVWLIRVLMVFFEKNTVIVFQLINAISLTFFYFFLSRIAYSEHLKINKDIFILIIYILGIIFSPLIYLCSLFYGNILGLSLSTAAIYYVLKYYHTNRPHLFLFALILSFLSTAIKMNYLIFGIAIIIVGLVKSISNCAIFCFDRKSLILQFLFPILLAIVLFSQSAIITSFTEKMCNVNLNDSGYHPYSHIAMGLQGEEDNENPGWWNSYIELSYIESGYSNTKNREIALNSIKKSIANFKDNPQLFASFLYRKINSQWNCPEFGMDYYIVSSFQNNTSTDVLGLIRSYFGSYHQSSFLNIFQTFLLFGTLFYTIIEFNHFDDSTVLLLVFVGGFLFHSFWEAKAIYALPYYSLIIPFSISGYYSLASLMLTLFNKQKDSSKHNFLHRR